MSVFNVSHTTYLLEQRTVIRLGHPDRGIWNRFHVGQEICFPPNCGYQFWKEANFLPGEYQDVVALE